MTVEYDVQVQPDFLDRMARTRPVSALSEMIWNALDADASEVRVTLGKNPLGSVEKITIRDNGTGIDPEKSSQYFSNLGASWKAAVRATPKEARMLHGENGQGRFKAFALGERVTWRTQFETKKGLVRYEILGRRSSIQRFVRSDVETTSVTGPGTTVIIENTDLDTDQLLGKNVASAIARVFALYMLKYPNVTIIFDGTPISATDVVGETATFKLGPYKRPGGKKFSAQLDVIEWNEIRGRSLYLCDAEGFTLAERPVEVRAPGYDFGAYLKSSYFRELDDKNALDVGDMAAEFAALVDDARAKIRGYFKEKDQGEAANLIQTWKSEKSYPFEGDARTVIDKSKRKVFDICAVTIHKQVKDFQDQDVTNRRLSFRLLREVIEDNPSDLYKILDEVLSLSKDKQKDFAKLLDDVTLSAVIDASKQVSDRISTVKGLEAIIFHRKIRDLVKERQHLHEIIVRNTWLFGERYHLSVSDQELTQVLKAHLGKRKDEEQILSPVLDVTGKRARVDMMISRRIPLPDKSARDHLIVELKRPTHKLKLEDLSQIKRYAFSVVKDARFKNCDASWNFWLVGNEMDDYVQQDVRSSDRPKGCIHVSEEGNLKVWVKTWGELLDDATASLNFFQEALQFEVTHESGLEYLEQTYAKYIPTLEAAE